jgi:NTP pyrophosphatase (non-canonical NTP hydrolase)
MSDPRETKEREPIASGGDRGRANLQDLIAALDTFVAERNWGRYHAPKNLAMALSVEVAEIAEIFQWMRTDQSRRLDAAVHDRLQDEIGDVLIYLTMLAHKLDIDPLAAAHQKLEKNRLKYPAAEALAKSDPPARSALKD